MKKANIKKEKAIKDKISKTKEKNKIKNKEKELKRIEKEIANIKWIMPIVDTTKENNKISCLVGDTGDYYELIRIKGKDLQAMSDDDLYQDNKAFNKFYSRMADDIKIIIMNFPTDTSSQFSYCTEKYMKQKNPVLKRKLEEQINILQIIQEERMDREFFLLITAKSIEGINKLRREVFSILGAPAISLCENIELEKKLKIIFKAFNKNTLITANEEGFFELA